MLQRLHGAGVILFQSTLPARGATFAGADLQAIQKISIHAPREGSDSLCWVLAGPPWCISIHAPREGSDGVVFLPRPQFFISIHAPREGSDWSSFSTAACWYDFNPRSPRGERPSALPQIPPR